MERARRRAGLGSRLLLLVVFVALELLFLRLGVWQLDRSAEKKALSEAFSAGTSAPRFERLPATAAAAARYATVAVTGRYDGSAQVLLDAMTKNGVAGYEVLTPFEPLGGGGRWLLVNRGWIAAEPVRSQLPSLPIGEERRRVVGRIAELPRPGLKLGTASGERPIRAGPVERRLFPTPAELEQDLGRPLYPYQLWLDPGEPDGFARDWRPGGLPAAQHWAYAVQWFALAALVAVVGLGLVWRSRARRRHG